MLLIARHFILGNSHFLYDLERCCLDKHVSWLLRNSRTLGWENIQKLPHNVAAWNLRMGYQRLAYSHQPSIGKNPMTHMIRRTYSMLVSLEESSALSSEDYSSNDDSTKSPEEALTQPLSSDEVNSCSHFRAILWSSRKHKSYHPHNLWFSCVLILKESLHIFIIYAITFCF